MTSLKKRRMKRGEVEDYLFKEEDTKAKNGTRRGGGETTVLDHLGGSRH